MNSKTYSRLCQRLLGAVSFKIGRQLFLILAIAASGVVKLSASDVTESNAIALAADIGEVSPPQTGYFKPGTMRNPAGHEISVNSRSLVLDGQSWFPVMGEMHYSRVPENEWRDELLKMKAGGVDIVATYVFWIHHEEIEGQWDWTGRRDLKKFLQTCNEAGLKAVVRCGPWCHGEVRSGGFPDWVMAHKDWKLRSTDTNFLAAVKNLYGQIAEQLRGELWKDGGPVIGIQVDNEFGGSPDYLMALKRIAIESGMDVPLYIKTGWPAMRRPVPVGELLPFFGAYADGFWERSLKPMNGDSWKNFTFKITRTDAGVGDDTLANQKSGDTTGTEKYPYLTCEIGGGMPASYHRRMNYDPRDIESVALCQLGSGSSLMGYYMFHGGQNPEGKLSTLQESTATGYPNDLPVKNYDFNAPIGEYGQLNRQYFWLRRLHLFLHDFGSALAQMPATMPELQPVNRDDVATLRWSVRSDGKSGFVFVNNYERLRPMAAKTNVQFKLNLPGGDLVFPNMPKTIPADEFLIWPFNLDLGGATLVYATAQPICRIEERGSQVFYFAETPGVRAEFVFDARTLASKKADFKNVSPGRRPAIRLQTVAGRKIEVVLLSEEDSLVLQKIGGKAVFKSERKASPVEVESVPIQSGGPLREIAFNLKSHLPIGPQDADFTNAAVWKLVLPKKLDLRSNPLLRIHYVGDVARVTLNGKLVDDDFYSGRDFEIGLKRYAPAIESGELRLEILPLSKDSSIYFEPGARPDFTKTNSIAELLKVDVE